LGFLGYRFRIDGLVFRGEGFGSKVCVLWYLAFGFRGLGCVVKDVGMGLRVEG
jgi:hypothetical protein